jgi:hypothetical protein
MRKSRADVNNELLKAATTNIEDINAAHAYIVGYCLSDISTKTLRSAIEGAKEGGFIKPRKES